MEINLSQPSRLDTYERSEEKVNDSLKSQVIGNSELPSKHAEAASHSELRY